MNAIIKQNNEQLSTVEKIELNYEFAKSFIDKFCEYRDITENTKQDYKERIKTFINFVAREGMNEHILEQYRNELKDNLKLKNNTKNKYLNCASVFISELTKRNLIKNVVTIHRLKQRGSKHLKSGLTETEIIQIENYFNNLEKNKSNDRLKALFHLLLFQGLRCCEIIRLNFEDLNLCQHSAFIRGKGSEDEPELITLHSETVKSLKKYLKSNQIKTGALFVSNCHRMKENSRLTTCGIRQIIGNLFSELEIENSPHGFRHTFITKLLKIYEGNLSKVMKFSRHKSYDMLIIYNDELGHENDIPIYEKEFKFKKAI